jgi:hypothetical protein
MFSLKEVLFYVSFISVYGDMSMNLSLQVLLYPHFITLRDE